MSHTLLKIISIDPGFVTNMETQEKAKAILAKHYRPSTIEFQTTDSIEFIDQGANFESVACNSCGRDLEMDEWQALVDNAFEKQFEDLTFITSCCHSKSSLNDLKYNMPAGFAKFTVSISEAPEEPTENELSQLEGLLGTRFSAGLHI